MKTLLVLTNVPDDDTANEIAEQIVARRLAACVNIVAPVRSIYRWQGEVETAEEVQLMIKVAADRYEALEAAIVDLHPYDLPEVVAIPIARGLTGYLEWVATETRPLTTEPR